MPSSRRSTSSVFAGDAYKTRDPNPTYQREFARRIKKIADAGIPVVLLVGNHDLPAGARRATSISIFDTLAVPNVYVADREDAAARSPAGAASHCRSPPCPIRCVRPSSAAKSTRARA